METITISKEKYDKLVKAANWLSCLEAAGVDNWEGWDVAVEMNTPKEEEE